MTKRKIRQLTAIMFSDIVGYSAMMHQDEGEGRKKASRYRKVLQQCVDHHGGEVIQHYGDGSLCIFPSAIEAVGCARDIQMALNEAPNVPLRIGIHVGDIVIDGDDIYGDGVNIASRVESMGVAGSVLMTDRLLYDIQSHPEYQTVSLGSFAFKNIPGSIEIFALANEGFPVPQRRQLKGKGKAVGTKGFSQTLLRSLVITLIFLFASIATYQYLFKDKPQSNTLAKPSYARLAVLPFDNLSGDPEQNYFVEGMTQTLIANLGKISNLRVSMSQSASKLKAADKSIAEIGQALDVDVIIDGSVIREGNLVRINAQMIDVATEELLWVESYDRNITSILKLHSEVVEAIVNKIQVAVTPKELEQLRTAEEVNPQAYELLLKGLYNLFKLTPGNYQVAMEYFQSALEIDSLNAQAYAGMALVWAHSGQWGGEVPMVAAEKTRKAAQRALALDKNLPMAHLAMAHYYTSYHWDWPSGLREFEKSISLNPNLSEPRLLYADLLLSLHRDQEAFDQIAAAMEVDPLNAFSHCIKGWALFATRQFDEAIEALEWSLRSEPMIPLSHRCLWSTYHLKGDYDAAIEHAILFFEAQDLNETAEDLRQQFEARGYVQALRYAGDRLAERARQEKGYISGMRVARLYAFSGDTSLALDWLEKAYEEHYVSIFSLNVDPHWESLHEEPRFLRLLEKVNLTLSPGKKN